MENVEAKCAAAAPSVSPTLLSETGSTSRSGCSAKSFGSLLGLFRATVRPCRGFSGRVTNGDDSTDEVVVWSERLRRVCEAAGSANLRVVAAMTAKSLAAARIVRPTPSPELRQLGAARTADEEELLTEASLIEVLLAPGEKPPEWWLTHGRRAEPDRSYRVLAARRAAILSRIAEARRAKSLYGSAEQYLLGEGTRGKVMRGSALMAFRGMCRRERIEVKFEGEPKTDGNCIWLGPIDFNHPLAPILIWGHGIHERNHVRYTDFAVLKDADACVVELANVFEDIRVDAIAMREYGAYRDWREALFRVLLEEGRLAVGSAGAGAAMRFMAWILGLLTIRVLGCALPAGVVKKAECYAAQDLGEAFRLELEGLILSRFPLESTAQAVALAKDVLACFVRRARTLREACDEDRVREKANEVGGFEPDELLPNAFEDGRLFVGADLRPNRAALVASYSPDASQASAQKQLAVIGEVIAKPFPEAGLMKAVSSFMASVRLPGDRQTPISEIRRMLESREARLDGLTAGGWARERRMNGRVCADPGLFARVWYASSSFGARLNDLFRRPVPEFRHTGASGWELDEAVIDRFAVRDERIFLERGMPPGTETAAMILCDVSGSLGDEACTVLKVAAARIQEAMNRAVGMNAQTAVFPDDERTFGLCSPVRGSVARLNEVLAPIPSRGATPLGPALATSFHLLAERPEANKLVVVLTDGLFQADELAGECALLKDAGISLGVLVLQPRPECDALHPIGDACVTVRRASEIPYGITRLFRTLRNKGMFG